MGYVFIQPSWFFIYSIILEIIFAIITLIVCFYAFKVYKLSMQNYPKLFGEAFLFISISYIIQAALNIILLLKLDNDVSVMINLNRSFLLNLFGLYAHALFFIIGLLILVYITLKIENPKVFTLLFIMSIVSIFFTSNKLFMFYVLSSLFLLFTVIHYFTTYYKNKKTSTLMVLIGMIFLLFSSFHFILAIDHEVYYVMGHVLELIAYALILINLLIILKNGKKKR